MEIFLSIFIFSIGLFLLILSADYLIHSSVKLAFIFRLTPLFIGLVLVAFGTSAPEAGVGIVAAIKNHKYIALGNIVGSNIANIGLILGLCALFQPLGVNKSIFKRELPLMFFSVILLYVLSLDLIISRWDGVIFIISFIIFCSISYKGARKSFDAREIDEFKLKRLFQRVDSPGIIFILTIIFLLGVVYGANLMVKGGVRLAKIFGISPWVIAITIFAVGTSLPELAASLSASLRKVPSISVGNIVGSNIFNIFFILGVVSLIRPIGIKLSVLKFEFPILFLFTILLFTVMKTEYKITRWEGLVMFLGYVVFIFSLFFR